MRTSLVQLGLHNHQTIQVRKNRHGEESLEEEQVLLVLPLPLPPLHLHLFLLLLFVSSQFIIWTVTMSLLMMMRLEFFSSGLTTN